MMAEVKKVQALLDLPSDNEDRFSGYDDIAASAAVSTNNETI